MSTYIEILRAHQKGKLKGKEPSAADESPDQMLQEEAAAPITPGTVGGNTPPTPELESAGDESPGDMLQEEEPVPAAERTPVPVPRVPGDAPLDLEKAGDEVRISVQLVKAADDSTVWAGTYDRKLADVLSLQSEVARRIVQAIQGRINPADEAVFQRYATRRVAPGAQDDYLRGKYAYGRGTPQGYESALTHFEEAARADSTFAPAYAGLASARFLLGMERPTPDTSALREAQAEAEHLDLVFVDAGFEWREPGCSMCLGMNPDKLGAGERCASTSNRNFEGRQGRGGRTHLVSPAVAAATAVVGRFAAPADLAA